VNEQGFARLDPDRLPYTGDVPPRRWLRFVDDLGRFLDGGFAEQIVALGWGPLDLFGVDRDQPFARIDKAGLLWLLDGGRLVGCRYRGDRNPNRRAADLSPRADGAGPGTWRAGRCGAQKQRRRP
jgi:hypothetical protein